MYVRIYWSKVQPAFWRDISRNYREISELDAPGLLGRVVSCDVNDPDNVFTISFWADRESVEKWETSPDRPSNDAFVVGSHSVAVCEVKIANLRQLADAVARGVALGTPP